MTDSELSTRGSRLPRIPKYRVQLVRDGSVPTLTKVYGPDVAARVFGELIGDVPHEEVWALLLNSAGEIIGAAKISQGSMDCAGVVAADVLRPALAAAARAVILGHNHPSGDPTPSAADVKMTIVLRAACDLVGVTLLDHMVVTHTGEFRSIV